MAEEIKGNLVLIGYLKEHRIKQDEVAKVLDRNLTTVNRKLNGVSEFTVSEAKILHHKLGIPYDIIFR